MQKSGIVLKLAATTALTTASALFATGCTGQISGMPNPWTDCGEDTVCAAKKAGFTFPVVLSNCQIHAMKGMIEVVYPLDEIRYVTVRKSDESLFPGDNSGDYTKYEKNEVLTLKNGVQINVRKNGDKIYVMYFGAESGIFSARCPQGMSGKEVEGIYNVIAETETKFLPGIP